jgi:hypothetical protein
LALGLASALTPLTALKVGLADVLVLDVARVGDFSKMLVTQPNRRRVG